MEELARDHANKVNACIARGTKVNSSKSIESAQSPAEVRASCESNPDAYSGWWGGGKNKRARSIKSRKNKRKSSKRTQSKKKGGRSKSKKSN